MRLVKSFLSLRFTEDIIWFLGVFYYELARYSNIIEEDIMLAAIEDSLSALPPRPPNLLVSPTIGWLDNLVLMLVFVINRDSDRRDRSLSLLFS